MSNIDAAHGDTVPGHDVIDKDAEANTAAGTVVDEIERTALPEPPTMTIVTTIGTERGAATGDARAKRARARAGHAGSVTASAARSADASTSRRAPGSDGIPLRRCRRRRTG